MSEKACFLTAQWRNLAMLNYEVDPRILDELVPAGTELDTFGNKTFVSMVGFEFLKTRVLGVSIPWHRNFDEVNLRFYVRRKTQDGWRRGTVFVKEIVPRAMIAYTARILYGENYVALPMRNRIVANSGGGTDVAYAWWFKRRENSLAVSTRGAPIEIATGSDVEFITEHYFGYARRRGGGTTEYQVEHPRWRVALATESRLDCDVAGLYGDKFVEFLGVPAASAFLAEGSDISVLEGAPLREA